MREGEPFLPDEKARRAYGRWWMISHRHPGWEKLLANPELSPRDVAVRDNHGQSRAIWNRAMPGDDRDRDRRPVCSYCRGSRPPFAPWSFYLIHDPYGDEPLILVGGAWVHTDCAEERAAIRPDPSVKSNRELLLEAARWEEERQARLGP